MSPKIPDYNNQDIYNKQILGNISCDNFDYSTKKVKSERMHAIFGGNVAIVADSNYKSSMKTKVVDEINAYGYVAKPMSITVNGNKIDALLMGKPDQINNGRWVLYSNPNGVLYEQCVTWKEVDDRMKNLEANYLFFNYPGVGVSEGKTTQQNCVDTYQAMLNFLEEEVKAKEIIGWGTSIGGGVQGAALENYQFNKDINYVFVKEQTFSNFPQVPEKIVGGLVPKKLGGKGLSKGLTSLGLGALANKVVYATGWTLDSRASSRRLERENIPEVIIQNTKKGISAPTSEKHIVGDGMISSKSSLARDLLKEKSVWKNKEFIGVHSSHLAIYSDAEEKLIEETILNKLKEFKPPKKAPRRRRFRTL